MSSTRSSVLLLLFFTAFGPSFAGESTGRPPLFFARGDLERIRVATLEGRPFHAVATELLARVEASEMSALPPLETDWWAEARTRPWSETYPQIFHHSWIVPARWAALARDAARAWAVTGSSAAASKGRAVLLGLSRYGFEFEHYDVGMNYTVWGVVALEAYELLQGGFAPVERDALDAFFARLLSAVEKNDDYWVAHEPGGPVNNHCAWHQLCRVAVGLYYGKPEVVERAFRSPRGIDFLFQHGFTDDGLWIEGSIPYQLAATAPLVLVADLLENAEAPRRLYSRSTADGRGIEAAYEALVELAFPDLRLPAVGDAYAARPSLASHPDWESIHERTRSPRSAWLLGSLERRSSEALFRGVTAIEPAPAPSQPSRLWPEHGYAALRTVEGPEYWSGRGWTLFATWSTKPVHDHADRLSIQLFGEGHLWLPDREARTSAEHAFSSRTQAALNRSTLCHNALLVDGRSQAPPAEPLELMEYVILPEAKRVTMADLEGRLHAGVRQSRTCIVRGDYVLDVTQVEAKDARLFEWVLHVDGTSIDRSIEAGEPVALPADAPWSYLREAGRASLDGPYWEVFVHEGRNFRVDLVSSSVSEQASSASAVLTSFGFPLSDGPEPGTAPLRILALRAKGAVFAALYRTGARGDSPARIEVLPGALDTLRVRVKLSGGEREHTLRSLGRGSLDAPVSTRGP